MSICPDCRCSTCAPAFADPRESLRRLRRAGLDAGVVAVQTIPFGPVMNARARRLELGGSIRAGQRIERLVVIRADKP